MLLAAQDAVAQGGLVLRVLEQPGEQVLAELADLQGGVRETPLRTPRPRLLARLEARWVRLADHRVHRDVRARLLHRLL